MAMICASCGAKNPDGALRCAGCGRPLTDDSLPRSEEPPDQPPPQVLYGPPPRWQVPPPDTWWSRLLRFWRRR
ncbi:MAG: zinc ribbon domain-containing protein [Alphaproteobacteria bacterium]|nr:zinc ribbon domain-containing protein [Alphaproteobacteria bacterium]